MNAGLTDNYFELFELPVSFRLDLEDLAGRYRTLQRSSHPDRFAAAGDRDRRLAVQQAARINEAYQALRDPRRRARYLLELHGVALDDERDTTQDPAFLMEQMELREQLAELGSRPDPLAAIGELLGLIETRKRALLEGMDALFESPGPEALGEAKTRVHRLRFFERLHEEAAQREEELLDAL